VNQLEHQQRAELHGAFGNDAFGRVAEKAARFFGTPQYIVGQTAAVLVWVVLNSTQLHLGFAWDVYPFIALNLLFLTLQDKELTEQVANLTKQIHALLTKQRES
jgi:uncharacterized membrane protein